MTESRFTSSIIFEVVKNFFSGVNDNFDFYRFPDFDKSSKSDVIRNIAHRLWSLIKGARYFVYYLRNRENFYRTAQLLADDESKRLFRRLIIFRSLGPHRYKIDMNSGWKKLVELTTEAERYVTGESAQNALLSSKKKLLHHENIPTEAGTIRLDCDTQNVVYTALKKQYYFHRNLKRVQPEVGDVVIDAGGCFGDTAVYFAKSVGETGHVYVFDPLPIHGKIIQKNIAQNGLENQVTYLPYAVGEKSNNYNPHDNSFEKRTVDPGFSLLKEKAGTLPVISIDDYCATQNLRRLDFIKMDIEGYELYALMGAKESIKKFRPKLAISLYHKPDDFFSIPQWLLQHCHDYEFFLDHYTIHMEETVLYGLPICQGSRVK